MNESKKEFSVYYGMNLLDIITFLNYLSIFKCQTFYLNFKTDHLKLCMLKKFIGTI